MTIGICCFCSPPTATTKHSLTASSLTVSSLMCQAPEKTTFLRAAAAMGRRVVFPPYRKRDIALFLVLSMVSALLTLYLTSRGFRRTINFWKDLAPLVVRYRSLKFKAKYIDKVDEVELKRRVSEFNKQIAPVIAAEIIKMGGIFVKIGQIMSTMGSAFLDDAYLQALRPLQDGVPPRPLAEIAAIIERGSNRTMAEMFSEFDEKPIGAASIGQVHRAVLRETGQEVVVKVQYPEVAELFQVDFNNMEFLTRLVNPSNLELIDSMRERHNKELNFTVEAENLREISRNMAAHGVEPRLVRIPRVRNETGICNENVLVLEYLKGTPLSAAIEREQEIMAKALGFGSASELRQLLAKKMREHFENGGGMTEGAKEILEGETSRVMRLASGPLAGVAARLLRWYGGIKEAVEDMGTNVQRTVAQLTRGSHNPAKTVQHGARVNLSRVLKTLVHVHGLQMIKDGVCNSDPHPGNVLVLPDGRLGLLDYGMVSRLSESDRLNVAQTVVALATKNKTEAARIYRDGGYEAAWKDGPIEDVDMLHRFATFHFDRVDLSPVTINGEQRDIMKILETTRETRLPPWIEQGRRLGGLLIGTASQAARPISLSKEWKSIALEATKKPKQRQKVGPN